MYGLKQAATLTYDNLKRGLKPFGYTLVTGTVGVWKLETRQTKFCLCVDNLGIKFYSKADAQHLLDIIGNIYRYTTDWAGQNYCDLTLDRDYSQGYVDISIPEYLEK